MKTLHFICMNFCFVIMHFAARFTHNNHDSIRNNNYAIVFQITDFFLQPNLKKYVPYFAYMCKYNIYTNITFYKSKIITRDFLMSSVGKIKILPNC